MKKYKTNFPIYNNPLKYYKKNCNRRMTSPEYISADMYDDNMCCPGVYDPRDYYSDECDISMPFPTYRNGKCYDKDYENDMKYMKDMYSDICKKILDYVEKICDEYDYDDSFMYEAYPDKEMIDMIVDRIYESMEKDNVLKTSENNIEVDVQNRYNDWYRNLIQIIYLNEMFDRRKKRKCPKYKKYYYVKPYCPPYYPTYPPSPRPPRPPRPLYQRPPQNRPPGYKPPGYKPPGHKPPGHKPPGQKPPKHTPTQLPSNY